MASLLRLFCSNRSLAIVIYLLHSASINAETYQVSIIESAHNSIQDTVHKLKTALSETGLDFEFQVTPNRRALSNLWHETTTLELIRTPKAMFDQPNYQRIDPSIYQDRYWLWVNDPKLCQLTREKQQLLTVVGISDIRYFEKFIYPNFKKALLIDSPKTMNKILKSNRAQVAVWNEDLYHL